MMCFKFLGSAFLALTATVLASPIVEKAAAPFFYKGHDLSSLLLLEEGQAFYYDTEHGNQSKVAEDILGEGGMNTVRLRIWVNPTGEYAGQYDLSYDLDLATRFSKKGYKIYLDFHFSDSWADPSKQYPPAAWPTDLTDLASTLRTYTANTLESFHNAGVNLALVSLGNEIRNGMLWPLGEVDVDIQPASARIADFDNFATLWKAAREGVTDAYQATNGAQNPQVMIHIDNGWNVTLQQAWFGALTGTGKVTTADWDVFGFSFYPFYSPAATLSALQNSLNTLAAQYNKPLHVVETDWPAICDTSDVTGGQLSEPSIPVSVAGQTEWVHRIIDVVSAVPNGLGQGVNYWEPAWLNNTGLGSACTDALLFSQDWSQWPKQLGYSRDSTNMFLYGPSN